MGFGLAEVCELQSWQLDCQCVSHRKMVCFALVPGMAEAGLFSLALSDRISEGKIAGP
jgi:hypothetical protein